MNGNAIISLSMMYALWESKRKDLLSLVTPFVIYAVGMTTKIGFAVDIDKVCEFMESEFGYQSFQRAIVSRILTRETSTKIPSADRVIEKRDGHFYLRKSLSEDIERFSEKRLACKGRSDQVTGALANYLNEKKVCDRTNYTQAEVEKHLLRFLGEQGNSVILSVDNLRQLTFQKNEINYFIGRFILDQNENQTVLMDYLIELVKGYFITSAIFLQAENPDITTSSFKDVTFYLDTRLLLAFLGYKSTQENDSIQTMVSSLLKNGANFSCFEYNIEEVRGILQAYKNSKLSTGRGRNSITLEHFDEMEHPSTLVEVALRQHRTEKNAKSPCL